MKLLSSYLTNKQVFVTRLGTRIGREYKNNIISNLEHKYNFTLTNTK